MRPTQDGVEVFHEKIGVFEIEQQPQSHNDGKTTEQFLFCRDGACTVCTTPHRPDDEIIDDTLADKEKHEVGRAVGIKHEGEEQERVVSEFLRRDEIRYQEDGQKKEKENVAAEYHILFVLGSGYYLLSFCCSRI